MMRAFLGPVLAFLAGVGALRVAIPLESLLLMGLGLALTWFGLLRLVARIPQRRETEAPALAPNQVAWARRP